MKNQTNKKLHIRAVCISAMCAALSVVLLLLGQALQVLDMSAAVLGGLITVAVSVSFGSRYAAGQMLVCTVLAAILLPDKTGALLYFTVGGVYPLLKAPAERTRFPWIIKVAAAGVSVGLYIGACLLLLTPDVTKLFTVLGAMLGMLCFLIYDMLLTRLVARYGGVIRKIMRK